MKLATWNVNSIRARMPRVELWLPEAKPDVLCLQELKVEEKAFPREELERAGYQIAGVYQKTYNGVAILSKMPLSDVRVGLDDGEDDPQARLIAATVGGVRVICAYAPNGQAVGSDKYRYKLRWFERLRAYLDKHESRDKPLILTGDFNVAPEARDVYDPKGWENEPLYHVDARTALEKVRAFGLVDSWRLLNPDAVGYSWWDYRQLSFPKNRGLRIDHIFATETLARACKHVAIDREERKVKEGHAPSDHAPVIATFDTIKGANERSE
jgi:exodeoxyribonuclease-3